MVALRVVAGRIAGASFGLAIISLLLLILSDYHPVMDEYPGDSADVLMAGFLLGILSGVLAIALLLLVFSQCLAISLWVKAAITSGLTCMLLNASLMVLTWVAYCCCPNGVC